MHKNLTFVILCRMRILESWKIMDRANQKNKLYDEKINRLKKIIPEAFQDGKLNIKELESLLAGYTTEDEFNYSFTWHGKQQAKRGAYLPTTLTLKPNKEKSKQFDETKNIYIEGDNLNVLKVLRDTYANKVKMIYIDPPYNTGNDFIYPDNFEQPFEEYKRMIGLIDDEGNKISTESETVGRKHTNWLNMMYSRLLLARDFLTDDGVIFISIDDNEQANLKKMCDEIFGNFIGQITFMNNPKGRSQDKYLATSSEYILIYTKNELSSGEISVYKTDEEVKKDYTEKDKKGFFRTLELRNTHREFGKFNRPNLFYPIFVSDEGKVSLDKQEDWQEIYPIWNDGFEGCWTWGKDKLKKEQDLVVAKKVSNQWKIYRKSYSDVEGDRTKKQVKSLLTDKEFFTEKGQLVFNELFKTKEKFFQSPKALELIKLLLNMGGRKDSIIMDFFSGSATTAHAVLQQNYEDGGNRKFIMVQLPEAINEKQEAYKEGYRTIAEIGQERIRRAGEKIISENPLLTTELDVGFKVFELTDTNFPQWNEEVDKESISTQMELLSASIHDEESAVYEVLLLLKEYLLDESVEMVIPHVYVIGNNSKTIVYLHDQLSDEIYQWLIKNYQEYSKVIIYDNALDQSQKINLQGTLKEKLETV
ncbi:site-specific DNA-methyltransferase [Enterococcus ureasiticus]|uniref:site-specific DNA-methyltransferase n=3 Tax=Enterococcus TaxID=1350 RepID=UPI001A9044BE|nr:site-specific DNA-methyltransferase [Enterococcus ureasiticus]MBO0473652.1 site-specific DNA-methyltransferase [Enterococcus ureasiticus]